jgi:S1-C subfamily serine protease
MPIVITFLTGPMAGGRQEVADDVDEVGFGRSTTATVSFPQDLTSVSHEHFALKRNYGGYKFVINKQKPVFMNGRPVYDDQDLPPKAEIQLSSPSGPRLRIERIDERASNALPTDILSTQKDLVEVVHETKAAGRMTGGALAGVAALVALLAVAGWFVYQNFGDRILGTQQTAATAAQQAQSAAQTAATADAKAQAATEAAAKAQADIAALQKDMPAVKAQLGGEAAKASVADVIRAHRESVYLVATELPSGSKQAAGTASVIKLPDGTKALATNAHVADIFNDMANNPGMKDQKLVVVQPKGPDFPSLTVTSVKIHPAYYEFQWAMYQTILDSQRFVSQSYDFKPLYDVAILYVDDPSKLGEPLEFASQEELDRIDSGDPLIMIGYPSERISGTQAARPEPTNQVGIVTSATTPFFSRSGDPSKNLLVQHSVPATGGASGSPLFNAAGKVVAYLNAGNIVMVTDKDGNEFRIPNAALVNYAQRADMLTDLRDGKADAKMDALRAEWAEGAASLKKTYEQFVSDLMSALQGELGVSEKPAKVSEAEAEMATPVPELEGKRVAVFPLTLKAGLNVLAASAEDRRPLQIIVISDDGTGKILAQSADGTSIAWLPAPVQQGEVNVRAVVVESAMLDPQAAQRPVAKTKLELYHGAMPPGG